MDCKEEVGMAKILTVPELLSLLGEIYERDRDKESVSGFIRELAHIAAGCTDCIAGGVDFMDDGLGHTVAFNKDGELAASGLMDSYDPDENWSGVDRSVMEVYSDNLRTAYIKDPLKCPFCGSESIRFKTDVLDISGESAYQSIHCTACGGSWDDTYRFMDVTIWIPGECQKCIKLGTQECGHDRKVFSCMGEK